MSTDYPRDARGLIDPVRAAEQDRERRRRSQPETADQTGERAKGRELDALLDDPRMGKLMANMECTKRELWRETGRWASGAYQEGQDAALLGQACNPYRRATRALSDPGGLETLGKLAQQWEDGYVSNSG